MKIDQDTFKNGSLNYGSHGTEQRERLYEWRWQQFIDLISEKYPEYFFKFYSHKRIREYHLNQLCKKIGFGMKNKLRYALNYSDLESVNSSEFEKILKKFRNYLQHGNNTDLEVRASFTQPLPQFLYHFQ